MQQPHLVAPAREVIGRVDDAVGDLDDELAHHLDLHVLDLEDAEVARVAVASTL